MGIFSNLRRRQRAKSRFDDYLDTIELFRHCCCFDLRSNESKNHFDPLRKTDSFQGLFDDCGLLDLFGDEQRTFNSYRTDLMRKIARGGQFHVLLDTQMMEARFIWWVHTKDGNYDLGKGDRDSLIGLKLYDLSPHSKEIYAGLEPTLMRDGRFMFDEDYWNGDLMDSHRYNKRIGKL